jgi:aminoglycoside phosphotransferase (APT) family kinase protein
MPEWEPDVAIDRALVRALLREQFPQLSADSARLVGQGFDNSVWVVDEEWAFRFPHRAVAVHLVARELAALPRLAPFLPVPIPIPAFIGGESELFPRPFFGHRLLAGVEPAEARLTNAERERVGRDLGRFLRALHAPATRAAVDLERALPLDPNRRADMAVRVPKAREGLEALSDLTPMSRKAANRILDEAEALAPSATEALLHGDLHVRHFLIDRAVISGVIDWGDVCVGDPAIDLHLVWSFLPPHGRDSFLEEYGPIDEETRLRARVLAIFLSALLIVYARHESLASLERETFAGLERTLVDWG